MNEQDINAFFGDEEPKNLGTGWWAGVLATFFGVLAFGGVLCLHFPQLLTSAGAAPALSDDDHSRRDTGADRRRLASRRRSPRCDAKRRCSRRLA